MRLLIVEDDTTLGPALQEYLHAQGYAVDHIDTAQAALLAIVNEQYHLIILDLNLPDMNGIDMLRQIRAGGRYVFVLILTAKDSLEDRVIGLDAGADDYMVKPFELDELAARVRVFKRRLEGYTTQIIEFGPLSMDTLNREVCIQGQRLSLSAREYSVLEMLIQRSGKVVTKRQIINSLSEWDAGFSDNAVEVYVYRLRKHLENLPIQIQTVRGFGYMLTDELNES